MNTENNKIIAEFMKLPTVKACGLRGGDYHILYNIQALPRITIAVGTTGVNSTIQTGLLMAHAEQLVFHKDWNWLMEVVEKIEGLKWSNEENKDGLYTWTETPFKVRIQDFDIRIVLDGLENRSKVVDNKKYSFYTVGKFSTKIEGVYKTCLEFIKWYNEQQK